MKRPAFLFEFMIFQRFNQMGKSSLRKRMPARKGEGTSRSAFTLFELLVVLALLIMIASLGMPSVARVMEKAKFKEGVFALQTELEKTRLLAMKTGTPLLFRVQIGSNLYEIASGRGAEESGGGTSPSPRLGGQRRILEGDACFLGSVVLNASEISDGQRDGFAERRGSPSDTSGSLSPNGGSFAINGSEDSVLGAPESSGADGFLGAAASPSPFVWSEPICFYPNGRTSTAVIFLQNNGEKNRYYSEVSIRGLTGAARISSIASVPPGSPDFPSVLSPEAFARLTVRNSARGIPSAADGTSGFNAVGGETFSTVDETQAMVSGEETAGGSFVGGLQTPVLPAETSASAGVQSSEGGGL